MRMESQIAPQPCRISTRHAKRAERLRLQDCKGVVRVGDGVNTIMSPLFRAQERALPACQIVDKQCEALMSGPEPRPAEPRVSDSIPPRLAKQASRLVVLDAFYE